MTIDKEFESFLFSQDDGEMYSSAYRRAWQAATEQSQKEIEALQAREKELVEALQNLVEDISKTHGNYTYEQAWINADEALANVRGGGE